MVRKGQAKASYMDESDSDSDFIPETRPPAKKNAKARVREVARTSTQDPGPVEAAPGRGRGAEARFQEELQQALRASCSEGAEGEGGESDREQGIELVSCSKVNKDAKKTCVLPEVEPENKEEEEGLVDEQEPIVGDSQEEVKHGVNSADTIVLDDDEDEPVGRKRNARVIESDEDELNKETEVAKNYTVDSEPKDVQHDRKVEDVLVEGDRKRESGDGLDSDRRMRKKPKRYAESSDSEDAGEGLIESGESEEELELSKKKRAKVKKSPAKKAAPSTKTKAAKKSDEKPAAKAMLTPKPLFSPLPPAAALPARPLGSHNPAAGPAAPAPRPQAARAPAWRAPGRAGTAPSPLPASPGLSPGLRRLGLSRNFRSPAPLHKLAKLN